MGSHHVKQWASLPSPEVQRYRMTTESVFCIGWEAGLANSKALAKIKFQYYSGTTHHSEGHSEVKLGFLKKKLQLHSGEEHTDA